MKRLASIVLVLSMIFSMFTTASAKTIEEGTSFVPNPMELQLTVSVGSKAAGDEGEYVYPPEASLSIEVGANEKKGVDYKAKLDMSLIRSLFDEGFIQMVLPNDAQARAEFEAATISTTVNVLIEYPAAAIIDERVQATSRNVGVLDAGSIFRESARTAKDKTLKITYVNAPLKVSELQANVETYLKDIEFTLDGAVAYAEEGNHIVKVTLSGETQIDFATKKQRVLYSGAASNVVNVKKDNTVHNHALEVIPVTPATCFETGLTEGIICRTHNAFDCGALGTKMQESIPVLNHVKVHVDGISETCTTKGVREHWMCQLCKSDFNSEADNTVQPSENFVILPHPHDDSVVLEAVAATCTTAGFKAGTKCAECQKITKAQEIIPALGHSEVEISAVAPTCTETGKTKGIRCSRCDTVLIAPSVVPATGHKFGEWVITKAATEEEKGAMERTCSSCGTKETKEIEKKPHTCVADENLAVVTKEPTCTEKGSLQNYCACGKAVGAPVAIRANGHKTEYVAPIAATCVAEGIAAHYTCVVCDLMFRDEAATNPMKTAKTAVDKSNHGVGNEIVIPGVEATCTHYGFTEGRKCKNCNAITVKQEVIDIAPHSFEDIAYVAPSCTETGIEAHKHCRVCDKDFAMDGTTELSMHKFVIPAMGHSYGAPVKNQPIEETEDHLHHKGKMYCTRCDHFVEVEMEITPETCIHSLTLDIIESNATCTQEGSIKRLCILCGLTVAEHIAIPKVAHDLERITGVASTCTKKGTAAYYICKVCDKMFDATDVSVEITEVPVLDLLEHEFRIIGNGNNMQCVHCKELIHVKKKDKDGNEVDSDVVVNNLNNVGVKKEDDKKKEDAYSELAESIKIESEIVISDREEVSEKLDTSISASVDTAADEAIVDKVVWDIEVNKITTHNESGDVEKETVAELDNLIEIIFRIPASMLESVDFLVHRFHIDDEGAEANHVIGTTPNDAGEYIVIDKTAGTVTLHVKKFSEYALVGYATVVNEEEEEPSRPSSGGGAVVTTYTVEFKANGGTVVEALKVKKGAVVAEPATTREGYVFAGWYTSADFAEKFDFTKPITSNITLYAKWEAVAADDTCDGTAADGCVALKFKDVDTSLWYHLGIDYVVENGMMLGVAEDTFAPDANLTRGMLVTVLGRLDGVDATAKAEAVFTDVASDEYYANYINWAVENNIVYGYGEGLFGPEDLITREQLAAIIFRYAQFKGYDVSAGANAAIASYDDYSSISEYAIPSVQYAVASGLMKGKTNTTFNPTDNSTRAEVATILYRFLEANK